MAPQPTSSDGFVAFFREYTRTWIHTVATAGLTAFGTLTIVHRWFVALALASYVVPPVVLYLRGPRTSSPSEPRSRSEPAASSRSDADAGASRVRDGDTGTDPDAETAVPTGTDEAAAGDPDGDSDTDAAADPEAGRWTTADVPTRAPLYDAAITAGGACAVGAGGVTVADRGEGWDAVLEGGPGASANDLRGVDATADGEIAWVAGDGGAVGRLDVAAGRHTDHSAPDDRTDNLTGVAVAGTRGDETILLINGSGEVLRGRYREGDLSWDDPVTPGSGSSVRGVESVDPTVAYCCDTNDGVFETTDGGTSFERIGLEADGTLTDLAAADRGSCLASADDGVVHRYAGNGWTPERVAEGSLTGIAIARDDRRIVACEASGAIYERDAAAADWQRYATGASGPVEGVAAGSGLAVAVGADGTVFERRYRGRTRASDPTRPSS